MLRVLVLLHIFLLLTLAQIDGNTTKDQGTHENKSEPKNSSSLETNPPPTSSVAVNSISVDLTSGCNNQTAQCVDLTSGCNSQTAQLLEMLLCYVQDPPVYIAFGTGVVLTAFICGLIKLCCRTKRKRSLNDFEKMEMVNSQSVKLIEDEGPPTDREVEYSDLDFSALKRNRAAENTRETTESDYAEIKREPTEETVQIEEEGKEEVKEEAKEEVKEVQGQGEVSGDVLETQLCEQTVEGEEEPICQMTGTMTEEDMCIGHVP